MTRAAVTGIGLVTPLGRTAPATLDAWRAGALPRRTVHVTRSGRPVQLASIPRECVPVRLAVPKLEKYLGWPSRLAVAAATEAAEQAGLDRALAGRGGPSPERIGVYAASGTSGLECDEFFAAMSAAWHGDGPGTYGELGGGPLRLVDPHFALRTLANAPAAFIAMQVGASGPSMLFVQSACAAVSALQCAVDDLALGRCDVAIVAACDSLIAPTRILVRERAGVLDRGGAVLTEGAAALVLVRDGVPVESCLGLVTAAETMAVRGEGEGAPEPWDAAVVQRATGEHRAWGVSVDGAADGLATGFLAVLPGVEVPVAATALGDMGAATVLAWVALSLADRAAVPTFVLAAEPEGFGLVLTEPCP